MTHMIVLDTHLPWGWPPLSVGIGSQPVIQITCELGQGIRAIQDRRRGHRLHACKIILSARASKAHHYASYDPHSASHFDTVMGPSRLLPVHAWGFGMKQQK